ncbi:hypothetical protein Lepto7376_0612 [[Leptolyngbya] sp. PCC 7376]|uniref:hypothetical protein n=1 Tax=[Leptolyngbya] sp. PCC 7376 TaxID=111781 RepID=UPI00029F35C0|nr:hypothetical protein [[Leptolyngbya] sp. PCC 7376]AFY37024.1 hypothetical protein Lepto7376_0612 [[Leptolyngbya] sp. PCC 7376]
MTAALRLFDCVPAREETDYVFLEEYLVFVAPNAAYAIPEIKAYLNAKTLNGTQLNAAFHKSWKTVRDTSIIKLAAQQFAHYLTTYGWRSLGIKPPTEWVYLPVEALDLPNSKMPIRVLQGLPAEDLVEKALGLLASGVALKQETIADIFELLEELQYQFTGEEVIRNKEAAVIFADKSGILPKTEESLFRYLFYKATKSTLVIKNKESNEAIQDSGYKLPQFTPDQFKLLAQGFNRRKPLWLAFKSASDSNRAIINRIAKLSKKYHRPLPTNVLGEVTASNFTEEAIAKAAKRANPFQLIKAINALRVYKETDARFYRIRNGKGWVRKDKVRSDNKATEEILFAELKTRIKDVAVYYPETVDYALPTSEKQFAGAVPKGSRFLLPNTEEFSLFGIYWKGEFVDLDLKAIAAGESIGWNAKWRNENNEIMFSGDVTSAPTGATEWIYAQKVDEPFLLTVNLYSGELNQPYKILCGYGSDIELDYVIDPAKVQFEADSKIIQKQMVVGMIIPTETATEFYLIDQGMGNCRVAGETWRSQTTRAYFIQQARTALKLSDVLPAVPKDQAEIDLSPNNLSKDSLLSLLV